MRTTCELVHSVREIASSSCCSTEQGGEPYGLPTANVGAGAGLPTISAIVRDTTDDDLLRMHPRSFTVASSIRSQCCLPRNLLEILDTTHELADRIGARSRPQVSNTLRLLQLSALGVCCVAANARL